MKHTALSTLVPLFIAACATQPEYVWHRAGSTQQEFYMESGQCDTQALSTSGTLPYNNQQAMIMQAAQQRRIYNACMQGKGWYLRPK